MFKRYIYTIAALVGLLAGYVLALLPVLAVRSQLDTREYALALSVWAVLAAVFLLPALTAILKKFWFFRGQGEPVVLALLQDLLLAVNEFDGPVLVQKQGKQMVAGWRHTEPQWAERLEKRGLGRLYELRLRFDNNTKTVTMTDRYRPVKWDLSPISVETGWPRPGMPFLRVETGPEWGVENYEDTEPMDYTFREGEIKSPILNTILKNGWNVRFNLF